KEQLFEFERQALRPKPPKPVKAQPRIRWICFLQATTAGEVWFDIGRESSNKVREVTFYAAGAVFLSNRAVVKDSHVVLSEKDRAEVFGSAGNSSALRRRPQALAGFGRAGLDRSGPSRAPVR